MGVDLETIFDIRKENDNKSEIDEIKQAKLLLERNGYVVKKWTRSMEQDFKECEGMEEKGQSKDCYGCSCSVCLAQ